ncbi:beta-carotene 15,15'-dioxygenase, Brp/Blh family [Williamsia sp. M5A3_1d]
MSVANTAGPIAITARTSRMALVCAALVSLVADRTMADPAPLQAALVALGLVLGVPHGALDHLVAARMLAVRASVAAAGYAVLAAGAWALLHWGGPIPLAVMIVASVVHFGLGEVETMDVAAAETVPRVGMVIAGAGCLILPLARGGPGWDETLATLSGSLARLLADDAMQAAVIGLWVVSAVISVIWFARRGRWSGVVDVAVVAAVGATVAPLTAFALWFGLWHAPRHLARLVDIEVTDGRSATVTAATRRLALRAAPATVGALLTLTAIVAVVVGSDSTVGAVAAAIVVLLALTAPHMVVVAALDAHAHRARPAPAPASPPRRVGQVKL